MSKHEITLDAGDALEVALVGADPVKLTGGETFTTEDDELAAIVADRARRQGRKVTVVTKYEDSGEVTAENLGVEPRDRTGDAAPAEAPKPKAAPARPKED